MAAVISDPVREAREVSRPTLDQLLARLEQLVHDLDDEAEYQARERAKEDDGGPPA